MMRSFASILPAAAGVAFLLLTAAGASRPVPSKSSMPAFKRRATEQPSATHPVPSAPPVETLFDEVGRLTRQVEAAEVGGWKRELRGGGAQAFGRLGVQDSGSKIKSKSKSKPEKQSPERVARLHLWLGEYKLARLEDPLGAYFHFRTINRLPQAGPELARLKGRAVLDLAIGRFFQGAYAEATQRFKKLLDRKTALLFRSDVRRGLETAVSGASSV